MARRRSALADVQGMAHQGLMIVTAEAGELDAAMRHGWQALSAARAEGAREAEALANLAAAVHARPATMLPR